MRHVSSGLVAAVEQQVDDAHLVHELAPQLRVRRVRSVFEPLDLDSGAGECRLVQVTACTRPGDIDVRAGFLAQTDQPLGAVTSFTGTLKKPDKGAGMLIYKYTIAVAGKIAADPVIIVDH